MPHGLHARLFRAFLVCLCQAFLNSKVYERKSVVKAISTQKHFDTVGYIMLLRSVLFLSLLVDGAIKECSSRKITKSRVFCRPIRLLCHPAPNDAPRNMKRIEIIDQKVPGQKDMFAPVLLGVPGKMTRCPCGFGAYGCRECVCVCAGIV